ncbi:NAD-dependent protein deacetylase sirtuin-3 isoform X2 [Acipenser ruthenus]|uniref:NAD-dependent protein deacetylase sirtuin-3 isoform X2 n=1 Tax=Acipenser ruthenus TaxID=7906 RepID=UPI0027423655|nr:NAD-dependent protein deacetylase sirtuin-3 isoform X2 [Acipenser ruthenus]
MKNVGRYIAVACCFGMSVQVPKQGSDKNARKQSVPANQNKQGPGKKAVPLKTTEDKTGQSGSRRSRHVPEQIKPSEASLAKKLGQLAVSEQRPMDSRRGSTPTGRTVSQAKTTPSSNPPRGHSPLTSLRDIAGLIQQKCCKNIIVVAGAGISTASGIPDFRTPGTGLYANLQKYNIPYPEAIFDIDYFTCNPKAFFSLAMELYPGNYQPNYIHHFVRMLHEKGLLLRMYTQNIDGLERMAGIPAEKLVEAHGTFSTASCHLCYTSFPPKEAETIIMSGKIPRCKICQGIVKPDIVFFGEDLPKSFFLHSKDFPKADLLIVMGTSLQIEPFASIVNSVRPIAARLLLNRDLVGPFKRIPLKSTDVVKLGDLVDSVKKFAHILGWQEEINELIKQHDNPVETVTEVSPTVVKGEVKQRGPRGGNVKILNSPGRRRSTKAPQKTNAADTDSSSGDSNVSESETDSTASSEHSN